MREAVILFTRAPVPGETKTRLMPCYTGAECAALHAAFLRDEAAACAASGRALYVFFTPEAEAPRLRALLPGAVLRPQRGEGLGARMANAFAETLAAGFGAVVLAGGDLPELRAETLAAAFAALRERDAVFLPTADGGYGLVGLNRPCPALFEKQPYGTAAALAAAQAAAEKAGLRVRLLPPLADIDRPEDVLALRARHADDPGFARTATGAWLAAHRKISVIVPVLNEEKALPALLAELDRLPHCEILFADGGSTDGTRALLRGRRVIAAPRGRAAQMNAAAAQSGGDILWFLHADSLLPADPEAEIAAALRTRRWGCFGIAFRPADPLMRLCAVLSNRRARRGVIFGDQGMFIDRALFFEKGMFPPLPLMEDDQFSRALRGEPPALAAHPLVTSARRYGTGYAQELRTILMMWRLRALYRRGADVSVLAARYGDRR